jgi:hypothetical protein
LNQHQNILFQPAKTASSIGGFESEMSFAKQLQKWRFLQGCVPAV